MSIDIRKAVENLKSQIREVPRELRSVFRDLDSYCLAKAVDIIDEKEMGRLVECNLLPPETPIFRGTSIRAFEDKRYFHNFWTFSIHKATSGFAACGRNLLLEGRIGELFPFKKEYSGRCIKVLDSSHAYKGDRVYIPKFEFFKSALGITKIPVIIWLEMYRGKYEL